MNCKDFECIVVELDRGQEVGLPAREHAAACAGCGEKLDTFSQLRGSLAALALEDSTLEAPARVEAALLKALAESAQPLKARTVSSRVLTRPRFRFALAAAAILILVATAAFIIQRRVSSGHPQLAGRQEQPGSDSSQPKVPEAPVQSPVNSQEGDKVTPDEHRRPNKHQVVLVADGDRKKPVRADRRPGTGQDRPDRYEIATDYFPMNYGGYLAPLDSGRIVRIKVPRSALRSYGLPVDPLRADEAIKADVVLGNDGMARAIRFVH